MSSLKKKAPAMPEQEPQVISKGPAKSRGVSRPRVSLAPLKPNSTQLLQKSVQDPRVAFLETTYLCA
jgi:hypothetical protein